MDGDEIVSYLNDVILASVSIESVIEKLTKLLKKITKLSNYQNAKLISAFRLIK